MTDNLPTQDSYQKLVEDCNELLIEHTFRAVLEVIEGNYAVGKRILAENYDLERSKIYGESVIKRLSNDIGRSERTIRRFVNVAKFYPQLSDIISYANKEDGKTISWSKICKQLEGGVEQKETEEWVTCINCKGKGKVKK